jgi:hypothetical protein
MPRSALAAACGRCARAWLLQVRLHRRQQLLCGQANQVV